MTNAECQVLNAKGLVSRDGRGALTLFALHFSLLAFHSAFCISLSASDLDEFRVKREPVFEFAEKPTVTRNGDKVTVRFTSKGHCDATVAVEDKKGRIVRHLAAGCLGPNAPAPFQKNSLRQSIVWDGKDDAGRYVDNKDAMTMRVSLGLKAAFDKSLFWSPHKRISAYPPIIRAAEEGVYVFEGRGVDHLRLYGHEGNYLRTIYPFPADKVDKVIGLKKRTVLQTGRQLPEKIGYQQATLLTSGTTASSGRVNCFGYGYGAASMAVRRGRIALTYMRLNRITADGTTGGLPFEGPATGFQWKSRQRGFEGPYYIGPTSSAFDPTGKWLYLTGYMWKHGIYFSGGQCRHVVYKLAYKENSAPRVFAGTPKADGFGTDNSHFAVPTSVACDAQGRVYVSDYMNNRIQVFDPDGKHLKTLRADKPTKVLVDPRSGEIYVFSWFLGAGIANEMYKHFGVEYRQMTKMRPTLTRLGPLANPKVRGSWKLPLPGAKAAYFTMGQLFHVALDFWAPSLTLWVAPRKGSVNKDDVLCWGATIIERTSREAWLGEGILLLVEKDGRWVVKRDFARDAQKAVVRVKPPDFGIQRLYVNEANHKLYLLEHLSFAKCHHELLEIDPDTGRIRKVALPFGAEDICFDRDGRAYLRTDHEVVRYDSQAWREVPWDYGEERRAVCFGVGPRAPAISALPIPGHRPVYFQQYGMWVSPKGHLAVSCCNYHVAAAKRPASGWKGKTPVAKGNPYTPRLYPGRVRHQEIHVWDRHGKLIVQDAVPGLGVFNGLGIDKDDNIYVMSMGTRNLGDKPYPNRQTGTLVKFKTKRKWGDVKILSTAQNAETGYWGVPIPLPKDDRPMRAPDTVGRGEGGASWMEGAEWFYGGVGIVGVGCICWHTRFSMDSFSRSFAVEPDLYSVAVLDTNGNLILRVGQYGNVDDPGVSLFYPAYVAADTDRRLFIADVGNARIVSVKLGYHAEERIPLKDALTRN